MRRFLALAAVAVLLAACQAAEPPGRTLDPNADVVVRYPVDGGGTIRFTVHPRYAYGQPVSFTLEVVAGSLSVRGPLSGRVLASRLEGEKIVRMLGPDTLMAVDVAPRQIERTTVRWDARDDQGAFVPADTYSLTLDFVVGAQAQRLGTVIEIRLP
jgi:hypothetical protein